MHVVVPPGGSHRDARRIELGPRVLTIGRDESCEVQLDVPGVDGEHAKISEVAVIAIGADCAIGDVPLEPGCRRLIGPGDEIQIGSVVLALDGADPSIFPPPPDGEGAGAAPGRSRSRCPKVRVVEGANFGDELVLEEENRPYVVGRSPKCDLVLEDREVSREHIKLVRRGYSVYLQDQSSTRGSWLGRTSVYAGSNIEWARPRMLKVGATVLSLELPEEIRRTAPPAQASAGMTPPLRTKSGRPAPTPAAPAVVVVSSGHPVESEPASSGPPATPAVATPVEPSPAPLRLPTRKAFKVAGPTIGRASGIFLLALAALTILGALFVVFSLME